jgi:general secretion pathway protein A
MALTFDPRGRSEGSSAPGYPAPVPVGDARPTGLTYEPFYGLREKPFSLTSDSRFFYQSRSHAPAFDDLLNAIRRRESLNVLTGDIGTGKTTLCRAVIESLDRKTFSAFVPDPFASREELLKVLLTDFGVASVEDVTSGRLRDATRTELSYLLYEFLGTLAPLQAFAVVLIDEAQNLSQQLLEEVRILSDADGQLQVVLVGQLELRERLRLPEMRQLDQRVSVHCRLQPLDLAGVAGYISHRLHVAGGSSDRVRFTGEAVEAIYLLSGGVPRVINRLCDRALRYGYSRREATIDAGIIQSASRETRDDDGLMAPAAMSTHAAAPAPPPAPVALSGGYPAALTPAAVPPPVATPAPIATVPARVVVAAPIAAPPAAAVPAAPVEPVVPPPPAPRVAAAPIAAPAPAAPVSEPAMPIVEPAAPPLAAAAPVATSAEPQTEVRIKPQLTENLESWLNDIEKQPELPPVDLDWRQRWHATNAVAPPQPERRTGVRVKIPGTTRGYTHVDRMGRRWLHRMFWATIALTLFLAAIVAGPASIAASLDIWSQVSEQVTPPPLPPLPPHARAALPAPILLPLPPLD